MKNRTRSVCFAFFTICFGCARQPSVSSIIAPVNKKVRVIELRNYLVKEGEAENFNKLFSDHFLKPMQDMGVSVLGKYKIKDSNEHFVWFRGYENMQERVKFLNDFYYHNEEWKKYKKNANELIRNSDNVYLLRPLSQTATIDQSDYAIDSNSFANAKPFVVVDFYIANTRLNELTEFYSKEYLPLLKSLNFVTTLWVSETIPNDFPQLPVFQDKNLLVAITSFKSEKEYHNKIKQLNGLLPESMKIKMGDIITTHHQIQLKNFNG